MPLTVLIEAAGMRRFRTLLFHFFAIREDHSLFNPNSEQITVTMTLVSDDPRFEGGGPYPCRMIAKDFNRFPIGQDPFNIELIWDQMYRSVMPYGPAGVTDMAISGVDLALWDLMGKALGQPVYRLAGGKTKESIPCYITAHPDCVKPWKDRGFLGVKIAAPWGAADGRDGLKRMQRCIEQTRAELGDDLEIMIDCYMSWGTEFSSRLAERVRDCNVKWFEDPLPNGWAEDLNAQLRSRICAIQVAIGNCRSKVRRSCSSKVETSGCCRSSWRDERTGTLHESKRSGSTEGVA